jgi:hypothetical protein|tara:strand:+ start:75 stop:344 length:270 start_codon:yes stop_codon:yes gene_type:complete
MAIDIYSGRKYLGPLDIARINAVKNRENLDKTAMLERILKEIKDTEEQLEQENIAYSEKVMLKILAEQLDKQLYDFLGVPYDDRTTEDN